VILTAKYVSQRLGRRLQPLDGARRRITCVQSFVGAQATSEPCLPTPADTVPSKLQWAYEIKHDGFRFICRRDGERVL
jgi:ATP-dependent DNA ligase